MYTRSRLSGAVRLALTLGATSAAFAPAAFAQEDGAQAVEKISVTGSRIQRVNMVSASPVTEITAADIAITGLTRVEDILNDMPALFAAQTANVANGSTGTATLNLRNLDSVRTLVLVNGRRLPSGSPGAGGIAADVNQIPASLIERIEVLTGGSSATYGSDAVAGVVNFILKDDFEGFSFDYQHSFYQHKNDNEYIQSVVEARDFDLPNSNVRDGHSNDFSFMLGANTADGRGNVTLYGTFRDIKALTQSERDFSACALGGSREAYACGGSSTVPWGRFTDFDTFDYQVEGDEFIPFQDLYNYGPLNYYQRPDERKTFGAIGKYEINEHAEVYAEVSYMDDRSVAQIAPSGNFFSTSRLFCGNPFLSDAQFDATCGTRGLTRNDYFEPYSEVTDEIDPDTGEFIVENYPGFYIGRRNLEGGPRQDDLRHTSMRAVLGMRGIINDSWSYDVFANHGSVGMVETYRNELSVDHMRKALDVTVDADGNPVCKSVLDSTDPNCVPWNIFQEGGVTDAALAYLIKPLFARGDTHSTQVSGYVTGDLTEAGVMVPGTSTGVGVVLGAEYRREALKFEPDFGFTSGDGAGQGGPTNGVEGSFSVKEIFGELDIPLVEGASFADELTLELAYRYSDYSTDKTTNTYKYALDWGVNDDVRFRASFQRAVRAGNIRELFRPQGIGLFDLDNDPCAVTVNTDGSITPPEYTQQECANTGLSAANYGSTALTSPAGQYNTVTGGNPDLDPESSDTFSFGMALSPSALPGFNMSIDYFKIEIEDAIDNVPQDVILEQCAKTGNEAFCSLINRGANGNLWIGSNAIIATDINIGYKETSGVDIEATYDFDIGEMGGIKIGLIGTWLETLADQPIPGADIVECAGYWDRTSCGQPTPEWRHNLRATWSTPWDASVTATWRHLGAVDELGGEDEFEAENYLDLAATWQAHENVSLRLGVNNVLDREPQLIPNSPTGSGNGNTFPGFYDALGRYVFAGVTLTY
ncbi:TonB-dependent receptor plug domain-containing protein [Bowmanella dokdonensis]|uniref:TonB-dependent receptor n=1 Tax=Bowmanella dokdonensis TaxID=751969 RepID=A0A939DLX9_9ALTE|nr:TonB-dependent receptor [Bowmanella dokdonensis]MBN7824903.1 TonB-dependent receptor [Bowmanella dokdonensis]